MDAFAERYLPIEGRTFLSRSGTWICRLTRPVDEFPIDRRTFYLRFEQIEPDDRWTGPNVRTLELRTSHAGFAHDRDYSSWLHPVVDGFLDSNNVNHMQEAYEVERVPQP
jgi:hypothetical protein